jgi:hypothetical protein
MSKQMPLAEIMSHFSNVREANKHCGAWIASNEKGDYLEIIDLGQGETRFIHDNFPMQRRFFNSNIPYNSINDFIHDMQRMGIPALKTKAMVQLQYYNGTEWVNEGTPWANETLAWWSLGDDNYNYRTIDEQGNVLTDKSKQS